jgi:hypothetical protein
MFTGTLACRSQRGRMEHGFRDSPLHLRAANAESHVVLLENRFSFRFVSLRVLYVQLRKHGTFLLEHYADLPTGLPSVPATP